MAIDEFHNTRDEMQIDGLEEKRGDLTPEVFNNNHLEIYYSKLGSHFTHLCKLGLL